MTSLPIANRLLSKLDDADIELLGQMERVELAVHNALEIANREVDSVYFIERGFASVISDEIEDEPIEIGLIGPEGMTGLALIQGVEVPPFSAIVQGSGFAIRVDAHAFREALLTSPSLHAMLMRYAHAFSVQVASTATANARLLLEQKVARWLLMVADRTGDSFPITHQFLSQMLAVRRAGVTGALGSLEDRGLIRTMRGVITIVDRPNLVGETRGTYGRAEEIYSTLLQ